MNIHRINNRNIYSKYIPNNDAIGFRNLFLILYSNISKRVAKYTESYSSLLFNTSYNYTLIITLFKIITLLI